MHAYKRSKIGVPFISLAGTGALDGDRHVKYWNVKKGLYSKYTVYAAEDVL
jgi:hypothetical protein